MSISRHKNRPNRPAHRHRRVRQGRPELAGTAGPGIRIEIVIKEAFAVTDTDMTPQLVKIRESGAQALICWTIGPAGARVAKNVKQLGLNMPLVQCHGQPDPKYVELAGEAAEGSIMPSTKLMVVDQLPDSDPQKAVIQGFSDPLQKHLPFRSTVSRQHSFGVRLGCHLPAGQCHAPGRAPNRRRCGPPSSRPRAMSASVGFTI